MADITNDNIIWNGSLPEKFKVPFLAWNRLEGRPRHEEFAEALGMSVHDPLWMLSRQWQFGEYKAEDRGSAIKVKMEIESKMITHESSVDSEEIFNEFPAAPNDIPLEVIIERLAPKLTLLQKADMGRMFLKKLKKFHGSENAAYTTMKNYLNSDFGFVMPQEPDDSNWYNNQEDVNIYANENSTLAIRALSGKIPNGWVIYLDCLSGTPEINLTNISASLNESGLKDEFIEWVRTTYSLPTKTQWHEAILKYKYRIAHHSDTVENAHDVMLADDYDSGKIDWYSFDREAEIKEDILDSRPDNELISTETLTVIPTPATFGGMPNKRLWEIEDSAIDFANLDIDNSEVVKQILAEFALVYSNDWFILPYTFSLNSRTRLKSMIVSDVFGEKTLLKSAAEESSLLSLNEEQVEPWVKWGFLNNDVKIDRDDVLNGAVDINTADDSIFIAPAISSSMSSESYEEVYFIRDEVDNKVWAVESRIFDEIYGGSDGKLASEKYRSYINSLIGLSPPEDPEYYAQLVYKLGDTVPENWIPFIPVKKEGVADRSIVLQRAALPRIVDAGTLHIRPRTSVLRRGINPDNSQETPMYINEEAIPRSGIVLSDHYQRTRWHGGKTLVWYGRKVNVSSYPVSAGLSFDNIEIIDKNKISPIPGGPDEPRDVGIGTMIIGDTFTVS